MGKLGHPVPILRSFHEARTKDFYVNYLGFELVFAHRFADWAPLYMSVKLGDCVVHLSEHYGDATPGAAIRIPVDDVDAYMTELRAKEHGNSRPGAPEPTPWGTREISICDPSSNRITFFTRIDDGA